MTGGPEEEVGETFSPDGRMIGFVRNNDMYVFDLATQKERRLTTDGGPKILEWTFGLGVPGGAVRPRRLPGVLVESGFNDACLPAAR